MEVNPLLQLLYDVASDVARREDRTLHDLTATGVFFMPEIAYAYAVGKEMTHRARALFPGERVEWQRELDLKGGGPTDLVLRVGERRPLAVEFKLPAPWPKYVADIAKLRRVHDHHPGRYDLAFCALMDASEAAGVEAGRIDEFEQAIAREGRVVMDRVGPLTPFPTRSPHYKSDLVAIVGVWRVVPQDLNIA